MNTITYDKIQAMNIIGQKYAQPAALTLIFLLVIIIIITENPYDPANVRLEDGDQKWNAKHAKNQ